MAISNGYATGADLLVHMGNTRAAAEADPAVELAVETSSREIDQWCGRRFWKDATATARTFYASHPRQLRIDDAYEVTAVSIDGTVVPLNDYDQHPLNGVQDGVEGWPVTRLAIPCDGSSPTLFARRCVITAKWGWAAVPAPVRSACLILAAEAYKTGDVPMIDDMAGGSQEMKAVYRKLREFRTGARAVPVA